MIKKVLIITDTYLPLVGGAELYTHNFVEQLLTRGYEVTILTNSLGGHHSDARPNLIVLRLRWEGARDISGFFKLLKILWRHMRAHKLIYANYSYRLTALSTLVGLVLGRRMVVFGHGLGTIIDKGSRWTYYIYRAISLWFAHGVVVTSSEIADIVKRFNSRVLVATAIDFTELDESLSHANVAAIRSQYPNKKIIVSVRRLVPKNGIQYMVSAMPYVARLRSDVVYLVVGDGRMSGYIKELATTLNVSQDVHFLGALQNTEAVAYLAAADVVVFPSSAEAMSLACIEAMYIGRPVVASAVGGLLELLGEHGERGQVVDLFERRDSVYDAPDVSTIEPMKYAQFAEAINRAISDEAVYTKVRDAKQFVAKEFDWREVTDRIISFTQTK